MMSYPPIGLFVQHFITIFLLRPPTDLVILSDTRRPSDLLQNVLQHCTTVPHQVWNLALIQHYNNLIDFRMQSPRTQMLFITIIEWHRPRTRYNFQLRPLQTFYNTRIADNFVQTHMLIFPDEQSAFGEHQSAVWSFMPPDAAILAVVYDPLGRVRRVSRDLRQWQTPADFLHPNHTDLLVAVNFDPLQATRAQRLRVQGNRIVPLDQIMYVHRQMAESPMRRDRPYIRLMEQYFHCTVKAMRGPWLRSAYNQSIGKWSAFMESYGWLGSMQLQDVMVPRFGRHQHAVVVPNWWHKQWLNGGGVDVGETRDHRAMVLIAMCAILFAVFVAARFAFSAASDGGLIVLDTWSQMLGNGNVYRESVMEHASGRGAFLLLLLSVWGLMNGLTMTTLLLDMSVNRVWMPVFQNIEDVQRYPNLTVVYDDRATLFRYGQLVQSRR